MFSWTRRKDHPLSLVVFAGAVVVLVTRLLATLDPPHQALSVTLTRGLYLGGVLAALSYLVLQLTRRRRLRLAVTCSAVLLTAYGASDAYLGGLMNRHLNAADVLTGYDAMRTGSIPVSSGQIALLALFFLSLTGVFWLALAALAYLPRSSAWERLAAPLLFSGAGLLLLFSYFKDLFLAPGHPLQQVLAVHDVNQQVGRVASQTKTQFEFHAQRLYAEQFPALDAYAKRATLGVKATSTPDVLFIHVESLRHDHFTPEHFPQTLPLVGGCYQGPHHFSTGNNTGNALFGALSGLSPGYADLARREKFPPLPLRALRELGYETHFWFPNDTLLFDQLLSVVVGPGVQAHQFSDDRRDRADDLLVSGFLAKPASSRPRFDYVLLDSTHYDYSYPAEFAKHLPAESFGLSFNPKTGEGHDHTDGDGSLRRQHEVGIKNRYDNAVLFVDSLLARLLRIRQSAAGRDTLIVIFGDHGEAFWDASGPFGHNTELSEVQTHVPLVICGRPGLTTRYQITSHADLFPSVFDWMNLTSSVQFMTGKALERYDQSRDFAVLRKPVTSVDASDFYAVFLPHLRVSYRQTDPLRVLWAQDELGRPLPFSSQVQAGVSAAIALAMADAQFRSP